VPQVFLPVRSVAPQGASLVYQASVIGTADVFFSDAKSGATAENRELRLATLGDGPVTLDWTTAAEANLSEEDLEKQPAGGASFGTLPSPAAAAKSYDVWKSALADALFRTAKVELLRSAAAGLSSRPGESERDFRARLDQSSRELRDAAVEKLRQKYAPKLATLQDRIRRAEQAKQVQAQQASGAKWSAAMSVGATILGALFGRKAISAGTISKATTAARAGTRAYEQSQDVGRADENIQAVQQQLADLNAQMQADLDATAAKFDAAAEELERISLRPKKTDVKVRLVALAWAPHWQAGDQLTPAWE
jgi:hypothetical protein